MQITLPFPDRRLSPNTRYHWRARQEPKRTAREMACFTALQLAQEMSAPLTGELRVAYRIHPPDRRRRDQDNIIASLKSAIDGVCQALAINDSQFKETVITWGEPVKGGQVVMEIEEL